jgi:hypothetical protein
MDLQELVNHILQKQLLRRQIALFLVLVVVIWFPNGWAKVNGGHIESTRTYLNKTDIRMQVSKATLQYG